MSGHHRSRFTGLFRLVALLTAVCLMAACGPIEAPKPVPTVPPTTDATQPATEPTVQEPPETAPPETAPPEPDPYIPPPPILTVDPTIRTESGLPGIFLWALGQMRDYAINNGLDPDLYTKDMAFTYLLNEDAREFCLEYPRYRNKESTADMTAYENMEGVPLFLQWDPQWGYFDYGGNLMGLAGCGPTTLAMAAYYFTGDPDMNPLSLAQFAMDNGYRYPGNGTAWSFMSDGAQQLGLRSQALPLHKETMIQALEDGALIICIMGPGNFTTSGHFILLTGYENGAFTVNDCNSITRSNRTWTYEELCGEIWNLWAIRP